MKTHPFLLLLPTALGAFAGEHPSLTLWYRQPAAVWTEALPIGNGRLGAMVFGGVGEERLQVNEDTLWTGRPHQYHREEAVEALPELRRLLFAGRQKEAEDLAMARFMSDPIRQEAYQPAVDVWLRFPHDEATDYRRKLDLDEAVASVTYTAGGVRWWRETFSSHPDQVLVHRVTADQPGAVAFALRLTSPHAGFAVTPAGEGEMLLTGRVRNEGTRFAARLRVVAEGGRVERTAEGLAVEGADAATVTLAVATAFVNFEDVSGDPTARVDATMAAAAGRDHAALRAAHVADHQALFRRFALDLGVTPAADRPTDERLAEEDKTGDPALVALLVHYGRYLLIASSRPGSQPANLQGIWNDQLEPPWGSKFTLNINFEMNYWPAEVSGLPECAEPMFDLIDDLTVSGARTARAHYGAPGWVVHHNTDLWRASAPINHANHGIWPTGSAWLSLHLWERWRFSGDREFLAGRAYPVMRGAALFLLDQLVEEPGTGWLITGPSNSPEHGGLVMGPAMDRQLVRALFAATAEAARLLGTDTDLAGRLEEARARVAPDRIGRLGQLQEWAQDLDDPQNRHRHVSHLWGVFPGEEITWEQPELMRAAQRSLELRGDGGTGWALGWKLALWARLRDGDRAFSILQRQLHLVRDEPGGPRLRGPGGTYPNLFDAHPPFQIDGNFAATAGVIEMLVQSREGEIHLLPARPAAWPRGEIRGVRARGGYELDLAWDEQGPTRVVVRSRLGRPTLLRWGQVTVPVALAAGEERDFADRLQP